jgi:predicted ATP-dependent endonuclease of OLD family
MIKVDKIIIEEFRGIRNLSLHLNGTNYAICGTNGTGKSGIVDALEFGLTGSISRLSGKATGGITVKDHAPHVDCRQKPEKSKVILEVSIPSLNKKVVIERCVKNPDKPKIIPDDADVLKILKEVESHPEFALSRRELIKYIITTPGDRAKEVQSLLKLDKIEIARALLQKISNADEKLVKNLADQKKDSQKKLLEVLEIDKYLKRSTREDNFWGLLPSIN